MSTTKTQSKFHTAADHLEMAYAQAKSVTLSAAHATLNDVSKPFAKSVTKRSAVAGALVGIGALLAGA